MLRPQPREKDRIQVPIPEELRHAIQAAHFQIHESQRDPEVRVDYCDAIQVGCLVGGRVGKGKRPFEFTYYPGGDRKTHARWNLAFHPQEIEDISDGFETTLLLYSCRTPSCGHKSTNAEHLCDCDYVNDPYHGNIALADTEEALRQIQITGITRESTRLDVIAILGQPEKSGGGEHHPTFGYVWPWIKYYRPDFQLRFEFQKSGKLRMISILDPNWTPGK